MNNDDAKAFLALTGLAKHQTPEAYAKAREAHPSLSDEELLSLALATEEQRNRALLGVSVKIPPSRRISCWSQEGPAVRALLECGHEVRVHPSRTNRVARCRRCLEIENYEILENVSGQKVRTT